MAQRLLPPEERERRLRVIESLVKTEGWKIAVESVGYTNFIAMQEVIDLHWDGKHEEAKILAVKVKAKQEVIQEPAAIIRANKPIFDEWNWKSKTWVRKTKDALQRIFSKEVKSKVEEQNART